MKKSTTIILILSFLFITGCKYFPGGSPIPPSPEDALAIDDAGDNNTIAEVNSETESTEVSADDLIKQVVEEETKPVVVNSTNETNTTEITAVTLSESLNLQDTLSLCPHLNVSFECNRYDIRRCEFKQIVGNNNYYPDLINCRAGKSSRGENPDNRYCLIQECQPIKKDNIVYSYGGPTIWAEYDYHEQKSVEGVMTYYSLKRCGEMQMQFNSSFDCTVYKSELEGLWP